MADIKAAQVYSSQNGSARVRVYTWGVPTEVAAPGNRHGNTPTEDPNAASQPSYAGVKDGDVCLAEFMPGMTDKSVQITGVLGVGNNVEIYGSNDGVNFGLLHDVFGNQLTALGLGDIHQINEECLWVQPVVAGGGVTQDLNIILVGKLPF